MDISKFKDLLIRSLEKDSDQVEAQRKIEEAGVSFSFREGFDQKVLDKIYSSGSAVIREVEFARSFTYVLYRIALPGIAAIVLLLISLFLMEGSFSFNSFLGIGNTYDESIVYLLTGN